MGTPTKFLIQCRGCTSGVFPPLQRKAKKHGEGRFYYVHSGAGCRHMEDFNPDIDTVEDLKAMVPGISLKEISKETLIAVTGKAGTALSGTLGEKPKETSPPETLKETPKETSPPETLKETPKEKEADDGDDLTTLFN